MGTLIQFRGRRGDRGAEDDAWMFDGLNAMTVVIEDLDPIASEAKLDRTQIQVHVEERLGEIGMRAAPLADLKEARGVAVLYVSIGTEHQGQGPVAFSLRVEVCEEAVLVRDRSLCGGVVTWSTNGVWLSRTDDLNRDVVKALDEGLERLGKCVLAGLRGWDDQ